MVKNAKGQTIDAYLKTLIKKYPKSDRFFDRERLRRIFNAMTYLSFKKPGCFRLELCAGEAILREYRTAVGYRRKGWFKNAVISVVRGYETF